MGAIELLMKPIFDYLWHTSDWSSSEVLQCYRACVLLFKKKKEIKHLLAVTWRYELRFIYNRLSQTLHNVNNPIHPQLPDTISLSLSISEDKYLNAVNYWLVDSISKNVYIYKKKTWDAVKSGIFTETIFMHKLTNYNSTLIQTQANACRSAGLLD